MVSRTIGSSDAEHRMQQRFQSAFADPILFDPALHEGRQFRRFLYERGDLLPDDERLLATAWLTVDRSVHEELSVERGVGPQLRNLATGDLATHRRTFVTHSHTSTAPSARRSRTTPRSCGASSASTDSSIISPGEPQRT